MFPAEIKIAWFEISHNLYTKFYFSGGKLLIAPVILVLGLVVGAVVVLIGKRKRYVLNYIIFKLWNISNSKKL